MANVSNTPRAKLFLLFIGSEPTKMAGAAERLQFEAKEQPQKVRCVCVDIDRTTRYKACTEMEIFAHFLHVQTSTHPCFGSPLDKVLVITQLSRSAEVGLRPFCPLR